MITEITKAQFLTWRLGVLRNEGSYNSQISMCKRNNVEMALNIAREAETSLRRYGNYWRVFYHETYDEFRICDYL